MARPDVSSPATITRLTFICPDCTARHVIVDSRTNCLRYAGQILADGGPQVLLEDETHAMLKELDACERQAARQQVFFGAPAPWEPRK